MIFYKKRKKYKYNLYSDFEYETGMSVDSPNSFGLVEISSDGTLFIRKGYAWDGPSGPTIDTKNFMRGSLVHDALYQLIREKILPESYRKKADQLLRDICIADGMSKFRANYVYRGVRIGGASAVKLDLLKAP